jgi:DNA polymerase I-like protein with 3'-5' exonuclease and polymerase domains
MKKQHPELTNAAEFILRKKTLTDVTSLKIGADGRCRYYQNVFGSVTGRHTASLNPFAMPKWVRSLIKPPRGWAYIAADWSSQEIGIAAYMSGDENMKQLFATAAAGGDVYMRFAELAGLVPAGAKREDFEEIRRKCKVGLLAFNYGGGPGSIAEKLGISLGEARRLHQKYQQTFRTYGRWSQDVVDFATQYGELTTMSGWRRVVGRDPKHPVGTPNPRALANWPVQSTGGDLLRAAAIRASAAGIELCGTIHDSLVCQAPADQADEVAELLQRIMAEVCQDLLGMPAVTDMTITRFPDRYRDGEKADLWEQEAAKLGIAP